MRRLRRGFSFVSFLFLVAALAAVWWVVSFGGAYWDNVSIKGHVHEAANMAMRASEDQVRSFLIRKLSTYENLAVQPDDVRIDLQPGQRIVIDLTYARSVKPLFASEERSLIFTRHVEQDLKPIKW
jgi:hypothetical protein